MSNPRGTSTLLMGPAGTGKTYSLPTFIQAGLKLAIVFTEPGGEAALVDSCVARGLPLDDIHWRYVVPAAPSWEALTEMAKKVNTMSYEDLGKLKTGVTKREYNQFIQLLATFASFICEHCGLELGPLDRLDSSWAIALDGLTGVNIMAQQLTVGGKPSPHEGEWGTAMGTEEYFLRKFAYDCAAFVVLITHVDREPDLVAGISKIMASALGRKLAPKLPNMFGDVVLAYKDGDKFFWSTTARNVDLKTRTLPFSDTIEPSFVQIVDRWRQRAKLTATSEVEHPSESTIPGPPFETT